MTTTKPAKTRSLRLTESDGCDILTITETVELRKGPKVTTTHYRCEKLAVRGETAFRLHKLVDADEEATAYDVLLNGLRSECSCPAGIYRGNLAPCKHVAALNKLREHGRI